jgi:polysaccharide export outer membrane protein
MQSPPVVVSTDCYAIRPAANNSSSSQVALGRSGATREESPQAIAQAGPAVSLLPPAHAAPGSAAVVASNWQPLVRVSAEQPAANSAGVEPGAMPLAGHGSDLPVNALMPPASAEGSTPIASTAPPLADRSATPDQGTGNSALPAPNLVAPPPQGMAPHVGQEILTPHAIGHSGVPREFEKQALPPYVVEPPDILLIESSAELEVSQPLRGQHLVRPDGTVNLGVYGTIYVAGMTLEDIRQVVAGVLKARFTTFDIKTLNVDVLAYNSKFYYIITDGGGYGEQVYRMSITGNETVLDALGQINGLPPVASKKHIWVARATPDSMHPKILPVDWRGITQRGLAQTNYQIFPGDRLYVQSDPRIRADSFLAKTLSPIERVLGATLLGSSTVNSIKNGSNTFGNGAGVGR